MNVNEFFEQTKRIFAVIRKPTKKELIAALKVGALGLIVLGVYGFIFLFIAYSLHLMPSGGT